jgi:hypothetical protein
VIHSQKGFSNTDGSTVLFSLLMQQEMSKTGVPKNNITFFGCICTDNPHSILKVA